MTILPNSPEWYTYFGDFRPEDMTLLFPSGSGSWDQYYGWLNNPGFWQWWQVYKPQPRPLPEPTPEVKKWFASARLRVPINRIPGYVLELFKSGRLNWLNPNTIRALTGGRWDAGSGKWITAGGKIVSPGSAEWGALFGSWGKEDMRTLFPKSQEWNILFGWLNKSIAEANVPEEIWGGIWPWDVMFRNMQVATGSVGSVGGVGSVGSVGSVSLGHGSVSLGRGSVSLGRVVPG